MGYADEDDLIHACGGPDRYRRLTDIDADGFADCETSARALLEAEVRVNSYIGKAYNLPLKTVPEMLRFVTAGYASYILKGYREALTEADILEQDKRMEWLQKISNENIELGDNVKREPSRSNYSGYEKRSEGKIASRKKFRGFS